MNKKFWYLTKMSLKKKICTKWFVITNVLLALAIIAISNFNSIIKFFGGDFSNNLTIYVEDNVGMGSVFESTIDALDSDNLLDVKLESKDKDSLEKSDVIVVLNEDEKAYLKAQIISNEAIDNSLYQIIVSGINASKTTLGMNNAGISPEVLASISSQAEIERTILSDDATNDENMNLIMTSVFPTIILPFFMLVIFLVQMVGGEICEEKTTRSMEIIISNVSAKAHLFSKVISSNIFVIFQSILLLIYTLIGALLNKTITDSSLLDSVRDAIGNIDLSILTDKLLVLVPSTIILMLLSFIAYAILSGVLASMTVNIEDFNQLQTPIMLVIIAGYYLSISASLFSGSVFIHVLSYFPFLSAFLTPTLYVIGDINLLDVCLSIIIMLLFIYLLLKKGLKVYKNGILNYSTDKVWNRLKKSLKG